MNRPAPKSLAVVFSFLTSFADEVVGAATAATFAAASDADGTVIFVVVGVNRTNEKTSNGLR